MRGRPTQPPGSREPESEGLHLERPDREVERGAVVRDGFATLLHVVAGLHPCQGSRHPDPHASPAPVRLARAQYPAVAVPGPLERLEHGRPVDGEQRPAADRIGRTERGRLFVVDYKTSKQTGDHGDFSEGLQAPLYAACVLEHENEEEVGAGYHYLRHASTSWHSVDRGRADTLRRRFAGLAREASSASEFPARPSLLCAWCGFNAVCPEAEVPDHLAGGLRRARAQLAAVAPDDLPR